MSDGMDEQSRNLGRDLEALERDRAIGMAKRLYRQRLDEGWDLSNGPCLSDESIPGWCVDVAHDPREPVDGLPQNQCPAYRSGRVRHFVELDRQGSLIRAQ